MRGLITLLLMMTCFATLSAQAGTAEARDVARQNNCAPKKIEVFQQQMGGDLQTTYRVECIEPKIVDDKAPKMATAMLVRCSGSLCEMLRPYNSATK